MTSRADLHVHSKHSNRPSEWILRTFRAPESFTEPLEIYRTCRGRGLDFVTITDHDTIDGALEIAHLPGTFLSCEVTAEFPEDRCEVHVLVLGITCSVAHPLFRVNDRMTLEQFEKLLVLFNHFETLNGMHDRRLNGLARRILSSLSPELIDLLAGRHEIEPWGATPWIKGFTGGSDDHAGLYIATAWTSTRDVDTAETFLSRIRAGRCDADGHTGSPLRLALSLQALAGEYFRRQLPAGRWLHPRLLDAASHWVSARCQGKGAELLDRASLRFLGLQSDLLDEDCDEDNPMARRIVA